MTTATKTPAQIGLTECERRKIINEYTLAHLLEYYDENWVHVSVQLKAAGIHLLQVFNSKVDPKTLNVAQSLSLSFHNPDPASPVDMLHFDSEKKFIKLPRAPLPVLDGAKHEIYVVPRDGGEIEKSFFQILQKTAPSKPGDSEKIKATTVDIPFGQLISANWGKCITYEKKPTRAFFIGRYESNGGLPPAFIELCENGVVSSNVTIGNALLDLATRFEAFSKMNAMVTKGQRPFCKHSFGQMAKAYL